MSRVSTPPLHGPAIVLLALAVVAAAPQPAQAVPALPSEGPILLPGLAGEAGHAPPAVALRPDGGFIAVWTDAFEGVVGRWVGPPGLGGSSESGVFALSADPAPLLHHDPVLARGADGDYLAVWGQSVAGERALFARPFGGQGELLAPAQPVAPGPVPAFAIAPRPGGGFLLAWWSETEKSSAVRIRFLGPEGSPAVDVPVAEVAPDEYPQRVRVAVGHDGAFAVSWGSFRVPERTAAVKARAFSSAAEPLGPAFDLVPEGDSPWLEHDIAAAGPGAYVLAWTRQPPGQAPILEAHSRAFEADGTLGPSRRLDDNDDPLCPVGWPSLAMGPDGEGVVAWAEGRVASFRLVARLVGGDGSPRSALFVVGPAPVEADEINGVDTDRDGAGRLVFGWGLSLSSPFLPPPDVLFRSNAAQRFQEVLPDPPPPPPDTPPLTSASLPGFRVWVEITAGPGDTVPGVNEAACIPETLCVSGRLPGRSEVFVRVVGPKPNGRLWPTLVKFSTSTVEVWIEQVSTGEVEYYRLEGARPGFDELPGLFDREGFEP